MMELSEEAKRCCERITGIAFEELVERHEFENGKNVHGKKLSLEPTDYRIPPRGNPLFFDRDKIVTIEEMDKIFEKI